MLLILIHGLSCGAEVTIKVERHNISPMAALFSSLYFFLLLPLGLFRFQLFYGIQICLGFDKNW